MENFSNLSKSQTIDNDNCLFFFVEQERLQCRNHNRCMDSLNKSNRRNCSACRLDKCIRLGMRVKRNRQKQHSSTTNTSSIESPKIIRNANRSLSESSSNHINGNYSQVLSHDQGSSQASDDIEINDQETGGLDDPMDYVDIPSLVQIEHGAVNSSSNPNVRNEFNCKFRVYLFVHLFHSNHSNNSIIKRFIFD